MNFSEINKRRSFLKTATAMAVSGSVPTFDALNNIAMAAGPIGGPGTSEVGDEYKAIVCIYLYGGQDHSNILIPYLDGNAAGDGTAATFNEYTAHTYFRSDYENTTVQQQTMARGTGNLSCTRASLASTTLNATTTNSVDPVTYPGGWTTNTYGRQFALHPDYTELRALFNEPESKLAIMANVGPLLSKLDRDQWFSDRNGALPLNLYSHDDQSKAWMGGTSNEANPGVGIGGRIAAVTEIQNLNRAGGIDAKVSTQVSIDGTNTFMLSGVTAPASAVAYQMGSGSLGRLRTTSTTPPASPTRCDTDTNFMNNNSTSPYCLSGGPNRLGSGYSWNNPMIAAVNARISATPEGKSIYHDQWRQIMRQSIDTEIAISNAFLLSPTTEDVLQPFVAIDQYNGDTNWLARQLRMVAAMIRASNQLGPTTAQPLKRQVFFVGIGGFDTHGVEFWENNRNLNRMISQALNAFWTALGRISVRNSGGIVPGITAQNSVTTFTMSEFGRTLDSNGDGSDHGWGNHQIVLGGAVRGGKIYGMNHNVANADIPQDLRFNSIKSRFMAVDNTAGAVPRYGVPPVWWNDSSGTNNAGGKALMPPVPGVTATINLNHSLDRGELLPTMASDAMVATIANWFGVPTSKITGTSPAGDYVFPTLHGVHGNNWNVGFMNAA
jgi:uncharacterized protein (DUF1501 family)